MKGIPDKTIKLIVTDPPYFLPATHYQTRKKFSRSFSDLGILEHFLKDLFKEFNRILKDDGHMYIFCDGQSYPLFYFYSYPFCKSIRPLIWDKKTSINGYGWRHQHELIIFAEMLEAKPIPTGDGDILRCSAVKVDNRKHPAEKPVELLGLLIKKHKQENLVVLDPFFGSGSTGLACRNLSMDFIGIDISEEYCGVAKERLEEESNFNIF